MRISTLFVAAGLFVTILLLPAQSSLSVSTSVSTLDSSTHSLNINRSGETYLAATPHALSPLLTFRNQVPYIIWTEIDSRGISLVHIKHREGKEWVLDGGPLNQSLTGQATSPTLTVAGSHLYAAWSETDARHIPQIYVKEWDGEKWTPKSEGLNVNPANSASSPALCGNDSSLYTAWTELNPAGVSLLYVKQWDGSSWRLIGDGINKDPERHALTPALAIGKGGVYLAWAEYDKEGVAGVYASRWDGERWEPMGEAVNRNPDRTALLPSLSVAGTSPTIAWMEYNEDGVSQIYVKRWDGKGWAQIGESLNIDSSMPATAPSLAMKGDAPFVVWTEIDGTGVPNVYSTQWKRRTWLRTDRSLNMDTGKAASAPSIAIENNSASIAFAEIDQRGVYQLYVKELHEADFLQGAQGIGKSTSPHPSSPQEGEKRTAKVFFTSMPKDIKEKESPPPLAFQNLPRTPMGEIDWMAGVRRGILKPFDSTDPEAKPPLTPNLDIQLPVKKELGIPDVVFPHLSHSLWLDCRNCHPSIFVPKRAGNPITMHKIIEGEYCARCHGVVAFRLYDCFRCHSGTP